MKDEAFDFLPLLLLLGITISLCFNLLMPNYYKSRDINQSEVYDKTAARIEGVQYYNNSILDSSPDLTYEEAILTMGSQNYFMPEPRLIKIAGESFSVQTETVDFQDENVSYIYTNADVYIPNDRSTYREIKNAVYKWCNDFTSKSGRSGFKLHFAIKYSIEKPTLQSDNCYSLCVVAYDAYGNRVYLGCEKDGYLSYKGKNIAIDSKILYLGQDEIDRNRSNLYKLANNGLTYCIIIDD
ncbi:MAG: hypothetical protein IJ593_00865 [Lachnospiraceae bacterium]|nr:hypothetical protein [Lachnospiraceae bacterium]